MQKCFTEFLCNLLYPNGDIPADVRSFCSGADAYLSRVRPVGLSYGPGTGNYTIQLANGQQFALAPVQGVSAPVSGVCAVTGRIPSVTGGLPPAGEVRVSG